MLSPWEVKAHIEASFRRSLTDVVKAILSAAGGDSQPYDLWHTLQSMTDMPQFVEFAERSALKMVTQLYTDQSRTWREAAHVDPQLYKAMMKEMRAGMKGRLEEQVALNAKYIRTLPADLAADITQYIAQESMKGRRAADIQEDIRKRFPEQTRARAELIARTEVSKTQSALVEQRARKYGVNWYMWRPVGGERGDGRTRFSHRHMANVLVNWNNPPAPENLFPTIGKNGRRYKNTLGNYHAGCAPNCRCYAEPVISVDTLKWPSKIYIGGQISIISRRAFESLMNT